MSLSKHELAVYAGLGTAIGLVIAYIMTQDKKAIEL